jgi:SAM-dependent methyltransferase
MSPLTLDRPVFSPRVRDFFGAFLGQTNLYLGSGRNHEPGFVNLDVSPNVGADVVHDLEVLPLPFADAAFDCVFGSHVFEHIHRERFLPLVGDLVRILRPGGFLISVTPYCSSDDAIDNPFHHQAFSETTWHYADRRLYKPGTAGNSDFGVDWDLPVVSTRLIPYPAFRDTRAAELEFATRHYRNVIQEIHVVLQKPEAR